MNRLADELSNHLIDELARQNYCVLPKALTNELVSQLRIDFESHRSDFRAAKIGRSGEASAQPTIRNDEICWINETNLCESERALFEFFEVLRVRLNRDLFLGLTDVEAHYARYDAGHFYASHIDQFQTDGARKISLVLYLNSDWTEADGGQLRLHVAPTPVDVSPEAGTLVCFTSANIEHEVLAARRSRMSIAAWFRRK